MLAPIILLVYNRPEHARQTLEALKANDLASNSVLYIFADGPKPGVSAESLVKIEETRKVIKEKQWCGTIHIREYEENYGVDESTIKHVTEIVNKYGKIIVLEDDIITSKGFLTYMNETLNIYESEEKVMGISGYMFPVKKKLSSTVIIKGANNPWGWATWKRAWENFNSDYLELSKMVASDTALTYEFNYENSYNYLQMLTECNEDHKPWDIRWYASVFICGGLSVWPGKSLVQNIGHDASGVHCTENDKYFHEELEAYITIKKKPLKVDLVARKEIVKFNHRLAQGNFIDDLRWKLSSLLPNGIKNYIKSLYK